MTFHIGGDDTHNACGGVPHGLDGHVNVSGNEHAVTSDAGISFGTDHFTIDDNTSVTHNFDTNTTTFNPPSVSVSVCW